MDRFERDPASAARPPECPDCDPPAQPDKAYPETPAPNPDHQPLRTSPEAPVLPDSHPEATPREYPDEPRPRCAGQGLKGLQMACRCA